MTSRTCFYLAGCCAVIAVILLSLAVWLPYTTTAFRDFTSFAELDRDTRDYQSEPTLQPLRDYFQQHCPALSGSEAAQCLSTELAKYPFAAARSELFFAKYNPSTALAEFQGGECVARSGLIAALLLANGIKARVVQMIPLEGPGHTVISVHDAKRGWQVLDPSTNHILIATDSSGSEQALWEKGLLGATSFAVMPAGAEKLNLDYRNLLTGRLLFPEPWSYMRVGRREAGWPYRLLIIELRRPYQRSLGLSQDLIQSGLTLSAFGMLWFSGAGLWILLHLGKKNLRSVDS